jgi:hypothetical protein
LRVADAKFENDGGAMEEGNTEILNEIVAFRHKNAANGEK